MFIFGMLSRKLQTQAKIHYLDIISGLPSYGAKCFSTNARDGIERVLLVSPRFGLSQIPGIRNSVVSTHKHPIYFNPTCRSYVSIKQLAILGDVLSSLV